MAEIIFIILVLLLNSILNGINFYLLVNREMGLKEAFKLTCAAVALNKFLFTGSGYLACSYFFRNKSLTFPQALSAFFLLEFLPISLWLILGIYFGAKLSREVSWVFALALIILMALSYKRKAKLILLMKDVLGQLSEMKKRLVWVFPLIVFNMGTIITYYFLLFRLFDFYPSIANIIKIISVSFSLGYLSPAPGGLGFKETGLVLLLMKNGLGISASLFLTVLDRALITIFWGALGMVTGFNLIKEEIRKRWRKR